VGAGEDHEGRRVCRDSAAHPREADVTPERPATTEGKATVSGFAFELSDEAIAAIAERAAALVLERLTPPTPTSEYLSVDEAADLLRSGRQRVYDLCSSGRLRRYKDGARVLVSRAEIEAHLVGEATKTYHRPIQQMGGHRANGPALATGGKS